MMKMFLFGSLAGVALVAYALAVRVAASLVPAGWPQAMVIFGAIGGLLALIVETAHRGMMEGGKRDGGKHFRSN